MRKFWSNTHWLLGIVPGVVLAVVGATGALLSFEHEIVRALNPGVLTVPARAEPVLTPTELLARARAAAPERRVVSLQLGGARGETARIGFAGEGKQRTEWRYADPYTGAFLGEPRGQDFFGSVEQLHRRLLAGETGKQIVGASTVALLVLCLSGLYLRWPRRALDWRAWLTFDTALKGRAFLWHLHAVAGAWVVLFYLVAGFTGLYWSYEWYRDGLFALTGTERPAREAPRLAAPAGEADLDVAWGVFLRESGGFETAVISLPRKADQALDIRYREVDPAHERAYSRIALHPVTGEVIQHDRFGERPFGGQLMGSMLALHSGAVLGWPGKLLMMAASLAMPLFAVTGWMMYLARRQRRRASRRNPVGVIP